MLTNAIFKVLNFLVFSSLILYYFKKTIIPFAKKKIQLSLDILNNLLNQKQSLNNSITESLKIENQQEEEFNSLESKIIIWNNSVQKQKKIEQQNFLNYQNSINRRSNQQMRYIANYKYNQKLSSIVARQAKAELEEYFAHNKQCGQEYNQFITTLLKPNLLKQSS